jgi:hypothetical protein
MVAVLKTAVPFIFISHKIQTNKKDYDMIKTSFICYALKIRIVKFDILMRYGKDGICPENLPTDCNQC